jgi:hypothetical protein
MTVPAIAAAPAGIRVARIAGWAILTALVAAAVRQLDWSRTLDAIRAAAPLWLFGAVVANGVIIVVWAAFWRALLPRGESTSFPAMLSITAISSALMNTMPFFGGHASSVVLLAKRGGVSRHGALSLLALDQLGEGIAKLFIFVAVALLAPLPSWMRAGILATAGAVGALFVVLIALAYRHRIAPPAVGAATTPADTVRVFVARWAHGLDVLRSWRRAAYALVCVAGMKGVTLIAILSAQWAFGVDLSLSGALLVLAAGVLGSMVPISPGNVGTYEAGVFLAYRHLGVAPEQAAALALVQHLCFMLPAVVPGYLVLSLGTGKAIASS